MKLKYYLRGLGIGIIVTALLMGYSGAKADNTQSKAYRAAAETIETDNTTGTEQQEKTEIEDTISIENESEVTTIDSLQIEKKSNTIEESSQSEEEILAEIDSLPVEEKNQTEELLSDGQEAEKWGTNGEQVSNAATSYLLNIVRGDDSGTVSRKLQNAGVVENASEFDAFLMQHGYDKKISVGVVEIPAGATWIEVAEKISGK